MADEANVKSAATLFGLPVGDLIDLVKNFTMQISFVGVLGGGFYFAVTQPDRWLQRFNEGRNEQQKNYLDAQNAQVTMQAAVEKERETIRANALKDVSQAVEKMSVSQDRLSASINDMAKHVMGRSYQKVPLKTPPVPTTNPNIPAPNGPAPDPDVDEEFGPFGFRTHD